MKDRAALLPNKRKITFDGEAAKYGTIEYADQPTEVGTVINKDNLLSDAVVSELGLTQPDPVPSDALIHLQRSAIQYSTMPTASIDYLNRVVFFIGTTGTYINGGLYQCVSGGGGSPTYSWIRVYLGAASLDANSKVTASEASSYINAQTDNYTLVLADAGKFVKITHASGKTLTVPKNSSVAFPTGTEIEIYQGGAGQVTIAPVDGDVTLRNADTALKIEKQYCSAGLKKIGENEWLVSGRTIA